MLNCSRYSPNYSRYPSNSDSSKPSVYSSDRILKPCPAIDDYCTLLDFLGCWSPPNKLDNSNTICKKKNGLKLILSILYVTVSILLWKDIIGSVFPLTLTLGIVIFIEGVFEVLLAFRLRPKLIWNWLLLLQGITMIILGISIWSEKPFSDLGILVLLPGINLLSTGLWTIVFSQAIALQLDTPSLPLVEENEALVTPNLHKSF